MAKFYGKVGFSETVETAPGVWSEQPTEKDYSGDVIKLNKKWQSVENLNDNLTVNHVISIIADTFAYSNLHTIRYITWMGVSWKITGVEVQRPRLILTIGGVYNGPKTQPTTTP